MNIYQKIQKMRVDLQNMNLKKSGENKFAGYKYYELGDILPHINKLLLDNGCASFVTYDQDYARLKIVNCEKPDEVVEFTSPMASASLKGAHDVQNLGAVETYQRRYLYIAAFEISESDFFDATQGKDQAKKAEPKKSVKKLSQDTANKLNRAIADYAEITNSKTSDVMKQIEGQMKKSAAMMDEQDAAKVLKILADWTEETIEKLGV